MTLADLINAVTQLATSVVPSSTIGLIVVAGVVIGAAAALVRRFTRQGR